MLEFLPAIACAGICALLRAKHGSGAIKKIVAVIGTALAIVVFSQITNPTHIVIITLLIWLGLAPGWGKYFAAFHGQYNKREKEIWGIDAVSNKIFSLTANGYAAGTIGMSLRWFIFFLPLFSYLGYTTYTEWWKVFGLLTVGIIYFLAGLLKGDIRDAEYWSGGLLGFLTVI